MKEFPFELPKNFLSKLGYKDKATFVGIWWDCPEDCLKCCDGTNIIECLDAWIFQDYFSELPVEQWMLDNDLFLGDSCQRADHWLIVSGENAYLVNFDDALKILERQSL